MSTTTTKRWKLAFSPFLGTVTWMRVITVTTVTSGGTGPDIGANAALTLLGP